MLNRNKLLPYYGQRSKREIIDLITLKILKVEKGWGDAKFDINFRMSFNRPSSSCFQIDELAMRGVSSSFSFLGIPGVSRCRLACLLASAISMVNMTCDINTPCSVNVTFRAVELQMGHVTWMLPRPGPRAESVRADLGVVCEFYNFPSPDCWLVG